MPALRGTHCTRCRPPSSSALSLADQGPLLARPRAVRSLLPTLQRCCPARPLLQAAPCRPTPAASQNAAGPTPIGNPCWEATGGRVRTGLVREGARPEHLTTAAAAALQQPSQLAICTSPPTSASGRLGCLVPAHPPTTQRHNSKPPNTPTVCGCASMCSSGSSCRTIATLPGSVPQKSSLRGRAAAARLEGGWAA